MDTASAMAEGTTVTRLRPAYDGLAAFLWSLRSGQYEDLDGAAERILFDDDEPPKA
jgi:cbb3-type cytochrome oxidase maturation protein